jgi:hypothetical protein
VIDDDRWYWCFDHDGAEQGVSGCRADRRLGPYESRAAAEHWRERKDARNERWDAEDRRWRGEPSG